METSRRNFIQRFLSATGGLMLPAYMHANSKHTIESNFSIHRPSSNDYPINIFSKNLQWLSYEEMALVAAELGFDGIDLTVRPEGHVSPERVQDDLPKAFEAARKAGLQIPMITTSITRADEVFTESILKTASSLNIPYYRMGWISYNNKISIEDNIKHFANQLSDLAAVNKKYNIQGHYQNHSGASLGSPVWDLYTTLKDLDHQWIGVQYDILHATVEGANSWPLGLKLLRNYIKTIDIKDFQWMKQNNKWKAVTLPLGEGMVDFQKYFSLLKEFNIKAPISLHYEYPLGGAEHGAKSITIEKGMVMAAMKKDVITLKKLLQAANLR